MRALRRIFIIRGYPYGNMKKQVPYATKYEIDENNHIYHNGRKLKPSYKNNEPYVNLYCDDGSRRYLKVAKVAEDTFVGGQYLTSEQITESLGAKAIPYWPRYAITDYGAVFCVDPPKRGKGANECFMVKQRYIRETPYVTLHDFSGDRKTLKVDDLMKATWNY